MLVSDISELERPCGTCHDRGVARAPCACNQCRPPLWVGPGPKSGQAYVGRGAVARCIWVHLGCIWVHLNASRCIWVHLGC